MGRARRLAVAAALGPLLVACAGSSPHPSASPSPDGTGTAGPSPSQPAGSELYLRAWYSQSLPPEHTFSWLPPVTVVDGVLLDGNVAVDAVFPGPLMIAPISRSITDDGVAAIIELAEQLGMLSGVTDFTGGTAAPGSRVGHVEISLGGNGRSLAGNPELAVRCEGQACDVEPATPEAFAAFWQQLSTAGTWLEPELGPGSSYVPQRVALMLSPPPAVQPGLSPEPVEWPLPTSLEESGEELPGTELRCLTLAGAELDALMPSLARANQLTVFFDEETERGALVRVLVPREPSPCPDQ